MGGFEPGTFVKPVRVCAAPVRRQLHKRTAMIAGLGDGPIEQGFADALATQAPETRIASI